MEIANVDLYESIKGKIINYLAQPIVTSISMNYRAEVDDLIYYFYFIKIKGSPEASFGVGRSEREITAEHDALPVLMFKAEDKIGCIFDIFKILEIKVPEDYIEMT